VNCESGLPHHTRNSQFAIHNFPQAIRDAWSVLSARWEEVGALELVRSRALRLLNTHAIRAGDALQLAAALIACDERPESLPFVCLDDRLRDAARKEGFPVLPS